ncbi:MAG: hypothetical protein QOD99_1584 [Chthoniobacter sp.]|jgi:hypothetical protein|nr:hypothetical protein [Chthoniobacter sp.]
MTRRSKITALLFVFAVCGTASLTTRYWQTHRERVRPAELYAVVNSQFAALRADNFPSAYKHASSEVRQKFSIQQFTEMIRVGYSPIVHAQRIEFGFAEMEGPRAVIQVFFFDKVGLVTPCIYTLVNEGESWKIESARVMRRWPNGARLGGLQS